MGMPPPGQQLGQPAGQQTIVLGRPGQPGSVVTAAGGQNSHQVVRFQTTCTAAHQVVGFLTTRGGGKSNQLCLLNGNKTLHYGEAVL